MYIRVPWKSDSLDIFTMLKYRFMLQDFIRDALRSGINVSMYSGVQGTDSHRFTALVERLLAELCADIHAQVTAAHHEEIEQRIDDLEAQLEERDIEIAQLKVELEGISRHAGEPRVD